MILLIWKKKEKEMKIWIKYGNEEARIDLEGCEYVVDLRKIKFMKKFGIQVPSTKFDS